MTVIVGAAVPAPKPSAPATSQPAAETSTETQIAAPREADALVPEALARPSKSAATDPGAASPSQATASAAKPQAGVQTTAVDAAPDIRTDAPAQTSSSTSTSFADLLAATRGATAEAGKPAQTHPALQTAPQAAVQVYTRFVERFDGRAQRFEVRLDPAELGRVDVRIEVGADKRVHAVLAVHDSAALTDLMRGQRALERALADAGIDLSDGGIQFELADDSGRSLAGGEQRRDAWSGEDVHVWRGFSTADVAVEAGVAELAIATNAYSRRATRLDLVA
jgi:flagellar hook-length control protein FliK